jgi:SAM-dependent methyltransferase
MTMTEIMPHYYAQHPGFTDEWFNAGRLYYEMVRIAPSDQPSTFVEVGCWEGRSTAYLGVEIINSEKPIKLYVVDTFKGSVEHRDRDCAGLYDTFLANLRPVIEYMGDKFRIYHMTSVEAAHRFKLPRFDFVFLDGSHEVKDVADDIEAWLPKVKPGGVLAGDDWKFPGVRIAVEHALGRGKVLVNRQALNPLWRYNVPLVGAEG